MGSLLVFPVKDTGAIPQHAFTLMLRTGLSIFVSRMSHAGSSKAVPRSLVLDKGMEPHEAKSRVKAQGRAPGALGISNYSTFKSNQHEKAKADDISEQLLIQLHSYN
eukprot:857750-Pelagomonas_calceolata.AAC.8